MKCYRVVVRTSDGEDVNLVLVASYIHTAQSMAIDKVNESGKRGEVISANWIIDVDLVEE